MGNITGVDCVCGKVAISADKLKQRTKVTHYSDATTFTAITTRTDAHINSLFLSLYSL